MVGDASTIHANASVMSLVIVLLVMSRVENFFLVTILALGSVEKSVLLSVENVTKKSSLNLYFTAQKEMTTPGINSISG